MRQASAGFSLPHIGLMLFPERTEKRRRHQEFRRLHSATPAAAGLGGALHLSLKLRA